MATDEATNADTARWNVGRVVSFRFGAVGDGCSRRGVPGVGMLTSSQALTPLIRRTPVIATDPTPPVRAVDDLN
ncbi:hypothetical protein ACFVRU_33025, partial [Streptomyces sp. NPDC057927]